MPELLFHGAAGEVTGSMHMIRFDGRWIALDCGLYQGKRSDAESKNRQWPVPPGEISAVVLSHAHTDHAGRLPKLVRDGFEGPIYSTPATRDLCAIMLPDSAHIQEEDTAYLNKKRKRRGLEPVEALYDYQDVLKTLNQFYTIPYHRLFTVVDGVLGQLQEAGHMLGSAAVSLNFANRNGKTPSLFFSGDCGRADKPILRNPAPFLPADVVICESTYGGTINERAGDAKKKLIEIVQHTYARGGKVIIPSFSVGRTQTIVYFMHQGMEEGVIPRHPVYVDSPLAINATEVYRMHPECFDAEARKFEWQTGDMLGAGVCTYVRHVEHSKALHSRTEPCTIISASGMCEAGRIRHHLKNNIENPKNTILIPGYQAAHTLGRRLIEGAKTISLFHETYEVRADVVQIRGFSAHADQSDLLDQLTPLADDTGHICLVHGEQDESSALAEKLKSLGFPKVHIAQRNDRIEF